MGFSLNKTCEYCGKDNWFSIDNPNMYVECCNCCMQTTITYNKQDFVSNFECESCGGLVGTLEENNKKIGVRCSNCGQLKIVLEKHEGIKLEDNTSKNAEENLPRCPKCNSTSITTGRRGYSIWTGLFGANKTVNRCTNCGHSWYPKK